jgi:hypothetical protein
LSDDSSTDANVETTYDVVRNRKTSKMFLVLDDSHGDRYELMTPAGDVKILPSVLFDGEPVTIKESEVPADLVQALRDREQRIIDAERLAAERERQAKLAPARKTIVPAKKAPRRRSQKQPEKGQPGVKAVWKSDRLTFYRHKISPLKFNQKFRIEFYEGGAFEITKAEFESHFNDVVMSPSYRSEGHYSYSQFPEKARKYMKN